MNQDAICYQWFNQQLIPSVSKQSQIKEDTARYMVSSQQSEYALSLPAYTDKPPGSGVELSNFGGLAARQAMRTAVQ